MKTPFVTREQLESLTQEFPTPFHLYDEAGTVSYTHLTLPTIYSVSISVDAA